MAGGAASSSASTVPLIVTSPTGTTWTTRLNAPGGGGTFCQVNAVVAMGSIVVAGGAAVMLDASTPFGFSPLAYSTDGGVTWTVVPAANHPFVEAGPAFASVLGLATDGTTIVAVGFGGLHFAPVIATSTDGFNWAAGSLPAGCNPSSVAWDGTHWVLGDNGSDPLSIAVSTSPGSGYSLVSSPYDNNSVDGIGYSSDLSQWAAVGYQGGTQVVATAGANPSGTWTAQTTPADSSGSEFFGVVWVHSLGLWVAVGEGIAPQTGGWLLGGISASPTFPTGWGDGTHKWLRFFDTAANKEGLIPVFLST